MVKLKKGEGKKNCLQLFKIPTIENQVVLLPFPPAGTSRELVSPNKCVWNTPEYLFCHLHKGMSFSDILILV